MPRNILRAAFGAAFLLASSTAMAVDRTCNAELRVSNSAISEVVLRFSATASHWRPNRARARARDRLVRCGRALGGFLNGSRPEACAPSAGVEGYPATFNLIVAARPRFCRFSAGQPLDVHLRTFGDTGCWPDGGSLAGLPEKLGVIYVGGC